MIREYYSDSVGNIFSKQSYNFRIFVGMFLVPGGTKVTYFFVLLYYSTLRIGKKRNVDFRIKRASNIII